MRILLAADPEIEVPPRLYGGIERIVDDAPYFGAANGSLPSPELVETIFQSEFDVAYDEGGLYVLTMHPNYTGHRSRAALSSFACFMRRSAACCRTSSKSPPRRWMWAR